MMSSSLIAQVLEWVAAHPCDVVHLSKSCGLNLIFGVLYQALWGARVLADVDDEELAFVGAATPVRLDAYLEGRGWEGVDWTRLAIGQVEEAFDGITVANTTANARRLQAVVQEVMTRSGERDQAIQERLAAELLRGVLPGLEDRFGQTGSGVSVIVLTLDAAPWLERLLATFFQVNTHRPIELIVVDHGSSDGTAALVAQVMMEQPGLIRWVNRETNYSFSSSRNLGRGWRAIHIYYF